MRDRCKCGSFAVNPAHHGRELGVRSHLCDVCYWREEANIFKDALIHITEIQSGQRWADAFDVASEALQRAGGGE